MESFISFQIKQAINKLVFIKNKQVFHLFTHPYEFNRNFKLVGNGQYNSAFGCSIEFGNCNGRYIGCSSKMPGLFQRISWA